MLLQRSRDEDDKRSYELSSCLVQSHVIDHLHHCFRTPDSVFKEIFPKEKVDLDD